MGEVEIDFPSYLHHQTVRKRLTEMVEDGDLSEEEADEKYRDWLDKRRG